VCWGNDVPTPPGDAKYAAIEAGSATTCGIVKDSQALECWGNLATTVPVLRFDDLSVALGKACGITTDGIIDCVGLTANDPLSPPTGTFKQLSIVRAGGCAIRSDQHVQCWGDVTSPL
jgi:hypothetical protein